MTSLEYRILEYVDRQCRMGHPPFLDTIVKRFEPDGVRHTVNALWTQKLLAKTPRVRKGAHRGFVLTEAGKATICRSQVG